MPVVIFLDAGPVAPSGSPERGHVQHVVEWRMIQRRPQLAENQFEHAPQVRHFPVLNPRIIRAMALGQNPHFKLKPGREKAEHHKGVAFMDQPFREYFRFLPDVIAENAALFVVEILLRPDQFLLHPLGRTGRGDELRMCVAKRRPGS